jgi:hypothetical protein
MLFNIVMLNLNNMYDIESGSYGTCSDKTLLQQAYTLFRFLIIERNFKY